jgi:hypothetical protein
MIGFPTPYLRAFNRWILGLERHFPEPTLRQPHYARIFDLRFHPEISQGYLELSTKPGQTLAFTTNESGIESLLLRYQKYFGLAGCLYAIGYLIPDIFRVLKECHGQSPYVLGIFPQRELKGPITPATTDHMTWFLGLNRILWPQLAGVNPNYLGTGITPLIPEFVTPIEHELHTTLLIPLPLTPTMTNRQPSPHDHPASPLALPA